MNVFLTVIIILGAVLLLLLAMGLKVVKRYEEGVLFRLGRVIGIRASGLRTSFRRST